MEPRTLAALGVVLVVAAVLAAQHFWAARPQTVEVPGTVRGGSILEVPSARPEAASGGSAGVPRGAAGGGRIIVDVSGKVRRPAVLRLPAGSRVADALRAAGGVRAGTDITGLNRARLLMDGEQIVVGGPVPQGAGAVGTGAGTAGADGGAGAAGPLTLGLATQEQLETLPGVGPVLARHIIDYRTEHGGFRSVDELREVKGIGDRRFADLEPLVRP